MEACVKCSELEQRVLYARNCEKYCIKIEPNRKFAALECGEVCEKIAIANMINVDR